MEKVARLAPDADAVTVAASAWTVGQLQGPFLAFMLCLVCAVSTFLVEVTFNQCKESIRRRRWWWRNSLQPPPAPLASAQATAEGHDRHDHTGVVHDPGGSDEGLVSIPKGVEVLPHIITC